MAKAELIITEEQAIAFGTALQTPLKAIARTAELSQLHGDTVASLYRVAALKEFRKVVSSDEIKALIIAAAGDGYEVAESATFKIPDEIKLEGAIRAMQKGYLLSDEAGPHFSVILGKGGVSVLIKEAGHRHKLRRAGCKQVDVVAAAAAMRPRPNAAGKFDMIVHGKASCVLAGEIIEVHRGADLPIILPCYESDGPDGHEAKARRRLLRDLWAKVSGDFEPVELSEVDDDMDSVQVQPNVKVIQQEKAKEQKPVQTDWAQVLDMVLSRIDDAGERDGFKALWTAVLNADSAAKLTEVNKEVKSAMQLYSERDLAELRRFFAFRKGQV